MRRKSPLLEIARILANAALGRGEDTRFRLLLELGRLVMPGYRFTRTNIDWWDDPEFNAYLEEFSEIYPLNCQRRYMVHQLIRLTDDVPGDTAECGVYLGAISWLIARANERSRFDRVHYGFDSWEGLSQPHALDGTHWKPHSLSVPEEGAARNLARFGGNVRLMKGWIPERFDEIADRTFAFVHIDVDLFEPSRDSIEFLYPRLNPGAVLVCDDYGLSTCPGVTKAMDDYLRDKPEKMVRLASGAGFMIKGNATSTA